MEEYLALVESPETQNILILSILLLILLLSDGLTAKVRTDDDPEAVTGRRKLGLAQVQGPNIAITAEVAVKAGGLSSITRIPSGIKYCLTVVLLAYHSTY